MTGEILKAVAEEAKALFQQSDTSGAPGTVILETDFNKAKMDNYSMPLLLLDMIDAPEMSQYPGGLKRADWRFGMNTYNYQPDPYLDDETNYSANLQNIIDAVTDHFAARIWLRTARDVNNPDDPLTMADIEDQYGFRFTLSGLQRATNLNMDGLILGWRVTFDSVAVDDSTKNLIDGGALQGMTPTGYPWNN